jgi:hypothetical protein
VLGKVISVVCTFAAPGPAITADDGNFTPPAVTTSNYSSSFSGS